MKKEKDGIAIHSVAIGLALQAVVGKLVSDGVIDLHDLEEMREYSMQRTTDFVDRSLQADSLCAMRLKDCVLTWWRQAIALSTTGSIR